MPELNDKWAAGEHYEAFMGRWSRQLAPLFLNWLQLPTGLNWLDVGCGTGALTSAICEYAEPRIVIGCDPAEAFITYARQQISPECATFVLAGVDALPTYPGGYGGVAALLALNFFPDPPAAITAMCSVAAPGATISACVWDYAGRMDFLRHFWDAAVVNDAEARDLDEGTRFPVCSPDALSNLFVQSGLRNVRCEPLEISTDFASFEDFWGSFLGGTGPAPSYVASLTPAARTALSQTLQQILPRQGDGSIPLIARAWAVRGTVH